MIKSAWYFKLNKHYISEPSRKEEEYRSEQRNFEELSSSFTSREGQTPVRYSLFERTDSGLEGPSPLSSKRLSRRECLAVFAGIGMGKIFPSLKEEIASLMIEHQKLVMPERGESLSGEILKRTLGDPVPMSREGENVLFLTFDDGPLWCTARILDLLDVTRHRATFFLIGRNLTDPKLRSFAVRALRAGHNVANHSYTHPDFSTISTKRAVKEILDTHAAIQDLIADAGRDPNREQLFFRFPYGSPCSRTNSGACYNTLAELNYRIAWWDVDTNDWRMETEGGACSPSRVLATLKKARPRDVVLLHDRAKTAENLPAMLKLIEEKHFLSVALCQYDWAFEVAAQYGDSRTTLIRPLSEPECPPEDFISQFVRMLEPAPPKRQLNR